jgi:hypothetical protein
MPAKTTKPDPDTPALTDELAEEVAAEELEYPEGTPELRAVHQLPRKDRPAYYKAMAEIAKWQKGSTPIIDPEQDEREMDEKLLDISEKMEMLAAIEDLLASVAARPEAFREWALNVPDSVLARAFNVYQRKAQPGEAPSSPS